MMTDSLGDTNVHIISRVDGSGTERRRKDYLRSSEFVVRTGFLADDILGRAAVACMARAWCSDTSYSPIFGRGVPHGHQDPDARVGRAFCRSLPCIMPAAGSPNPVGHHRTAVTRSDLGEVGC